MNNQTILDILTQTSEYVSGQSLAAQLGVTRQAVWKEIRALRARGYVIESVTNRGYRLTALPEYLNAAAVRRSLTAKIIGCELEVLESDDSTNDYLKARGANGCKSGTVAAAREQVSGKGRLGRTWQSSKDENVMFSVLIRPQIAPPDAAAVTPLTGLAVCKALRRFTGLDCRIKWPNDVIIGSKKVVGILTEMSAEFDAVEYVVTGIGVNVDVQAFPEEIAQKATSLWLESGVHYDKNKLLAALLNQLEEEFLRNNLELSANALEEYTALCASLGRTVCFSRGGSTVTGKATGISKGGELLVTLENGEVLAVNSGEVTAQGIY